MKIRTPKSEIRKRSEIRNPNVSAPEVLLASISLDAMARKGRPRMDWRSSFRRSGFGFLSDFGLRISDLHFVCRATIALFLAVIPLGQAAQLVATDSLSQTLATAHDGDTIVVPGPRVFHEHVVINKSVRLVGTNSPVIDGGTTGTVLTIAAPNVQVSALTIRGSGADLTTFDSGIMVLSNAAAVISCRVENDGFGIYLRGASACRVESNEIIGVGDVPPSKRGNGIHLWKTKENSIARNRIRNKRDGMYFSYADKNLIAANDIADTRFGIHYMYSHQNRLLSNSLTDNAVGATLMFSRQSLVQGNRIVANRRHGLLLKQVDQSQIVGNEITRHNRGLFVQQATQNRFEGNTVATNDIGLYLSNCSEQNVFVRNNFIHNTDQVWQPADEVEAGRLASNRFYENRVGNYWSDYTGADRNHDGIGDTPYHETDVFGYIVERHPDARALSLSPAVALLRKGEELMPLLDTPGVTDPYPLMNVAQVCNLRYRSFVSCETSVSPDTTTPATHPQPVANRRYGRLKTSATALRR